MHSHWIRFSVFLAIASLIYGVADNIAGNRFEGMILRIDDTISKPQPLGLIIKERSSLLYEVSAETSADLLKSIFSGFRRDTINLEVAEEDVETRWVLNAALSHVRCVSSHKLVCAST